MDQAEIIFRDIEILPGRGTIQAEWKGNPRGQVRISIPLLRRLIRIPIESEADLPERLSIFPWPLRLVSREIDLPWNAAYYVRDDQGVWLYWAVRSRVCKVWWWFKPRLIYTAVVWGLAYVPAGEAPSWKHLGRRRN